MYYVYVYYVYVYYVYVYYVTWLHLIVKYPYALVVKYPMILLRILFLLGAGDLCVAAFGLDPGGVGIPVVKWCLNGDFMDLLWISW